MSKHLLVLCACALGGIQAFAQTSSTTISNSTISNTSVASPQVTVNSTKPKFKIGYLGILRGPGLNSTDFSQADSNGASAEEFENRFRFLFAPHGDFDLGLEARVTAAAAQTGMQFLNGDYRLVANLKHLYKSGPFDLTLTPRIKLPTSSISQDRKLIFGGELIANMDIALNNSSWSFNTGTTFQENFFQASAAAGNVTTVIQPWFGVDYQFRDGIGAFVAMYPELISQAGTGIGLFNDSNEINVGANWEFLKGWTASPYISIETVGMDASTLSNSAKNMQFNLYLSGALL